MRISLFSHILRITRISRISRISRKSQASAPLALKRNVALLLTLAFTAVYVADPAAEIFSVYAAKESPLAIVTQPADVTAKPGDTVTFSVEAQGDGLSYQWYYKKSGAGAWSVWKSHTTAVTTATANATWNMMQVYCRVTDSAGHSADSEPAVIRVSQPLRLLSQPSDATVKVGDLVKFSVSAQGSGTLKYQWYYRKQGAGSWSVWKSHTTAVTAATVNATWNMMQVYCKVTDDSGSSVRSDAATLKVLQPLTVLTHPQDVSVKSGKKVPFSVTAQGFGEFTYQWYIRRQGDRTWTAWSGRTTAEISETLDDTMDGMQVYCRVVDESGSKVNSNSAAVTVIPDLVITSQPAPVTLHSGDTATFSVAAQGMGEISYQWYYKKAGRTDWTLWSGKTAGSVSAVADCTWHGMEVFCRVTDEAGQTADSKSVFAMITKISDKRYIIRSFTVKSDKTKIYNGPGTNNTQLGTVNAGQKFTALEWGSDSNDVTWFRFKWNGKDAWISRKSTTVSDQFVNIHNRSFKDGGIPVIYLSPSRQIHNAYATGSTTEQIQMYRVGNELKKILEEEYVCMVYMPEVSMPISLMKRPYDAYTKEADVYLAIHSNATSYSSNTAYGAVGYYFPGCAQSKLLAQNMTDEMGKIAMKPSTVGSKTVNGMTAFDNIGYGEVRDPSYFGMISVLAEVEFHDNADSARWIIDNPEKIARALANALEKTIDMQKK